MPRAVPAVLAVLMQDLNDLGNTPLNGVGEASQILSSVVNVHRNVAPAVVTHYNATPSIDIFGAVQDTDLGFVASQIGGIVAKAKKDLPRGSNIVVRGQVQTMRSSFNGLRLRISPTPNT